MKLTKRKDQSEEVERVEVMRMDQMIYKLGCVGCSQPLGMEASA
jgi:hypothetical protein